MKSIPSARLGTGSLDKSVALLSAVVRDDGQTRVADIAARLGLASSTARRILASLERHKLLTRYERGRYAAGLQLLDLTRSIDPYGVLIRVARPKMRRLAREIGATAHLGVYEEGMVTYLVKESPPHRSIFTRELGQLEAYCTGVGKVLLAYLEGEALASYLTGSFVRLTAHTLTEPAELRAELAAIRRRGYALDDREMSEDVFCVAVPIFDGCGAPIAALSVSATPKELPRSGIRQLVPLLTKSASLISNKAGY